MPDLTNAEINKAVAERVMGWTLQTHSDPEECDYEAWYGDDGEVAKYGFDDWNPAENIADAMEAVEKWASADGRRHWHTDNWGMRIDERYETSLHDNLTVTRRVLGSLTLSICLALLAAVEETK